MFVGYNSKLTFTVVRISGDAGIKMKNSVVVMGLVALLTACGSGDVKQAAPDCVFPDAQESLAPGWLCDEPVEGVEVAAVGAAEKTGAGHNFMKNMAVTDARLQLAQAMKVHVQDMVKQYAETTGAASTETVDRVNTSVTKQITDQALVGTRVFKTLVSPNGELYVLLGMDASSTAAATQEVLKTSMNNDRALWQQFKAEKGQDELAEAIATMKAQ